MRKFKVGDRVLIIDTVGTDRTGQEGVVVEDNGSNKYPLNVEFKNEDEDGNTKEWFDHSDLQLAKNTIVKEILNDL